MVALRPLLAALSAPLLPLTAAALAPLAAALLSAPLPAQAEAALPAASEAEQPAVLITGASSGIGRKTAELFAARGWRVYAGARKQADLDALNAIDNIEAVRLDVTVPEEIAAAVETVRAGGRGLDGLINNAGVVVIAPMIELSEEDLDFQLDVNVYGPYRVTKAFAPLLIESQGRVSTTGSISGFLTWGFGGPYCMSKHAVEAFTDALVAELAPFGVQASVVEPGNYRSRITANMGQRLKERGYTTEGSRYQGQLDGIFAGSQDRRAFQEPDAVAEAFWHAMTADEPKRRYLVVPNAYEAELTIRAALEKVAQLNLEQDYSFERERLIEMLEQAIDRAEG